VHLLAFNLYLILKQGSFLPKFFVRPNIWGPPIGLNQTLSPVVRAHALRKNVAEKKGSAGEGENDSEAPAATARRRRRTARRRDCRRREASGLHAAVGEPRGAVVRSPRRRWKTVGLGAARRSLRAAGLGAAWRRPLTSMPPLENRRPQGRVAPPSCLHGTAGEPRASGARGATLPLSRRHWGSAGLGSCVVALRPLMPPPDPPLPQ
jgi:hypothetical protein